MKNQNLEATMPQNNEEQVLPEQNNTGNNSEKRLIDERLALLIASEFFTTDDWEIGYFDSPRRYAIPKEQLTKEEIISLWGEELPDDASIALHPLETCIDNFPFGYFTDLAGDKIKPCKAGQYAVVIYGFDIFKKIMTEYLSEGHDDYLKTVSKQC